MDPFEDFSEEEEKKSDYPRGYHLWMLWVILTLMLLPLRYWLQRALQFSPEIHTTLFSYLVLILQLLGVHFSLRCVYHLQQGIRPQNHVVNQVILAKGPLDLVQRYFPQVSGRLSLTVMWLMGWMVYFVVIQGNMPNEVQLILLMIGVLLGVLIEKLLKYWGGNQYQWNRLLKRCVSQGWLVGCALMVLYREEMELSAFFTSLLGRNPVQFKSAFLEYLHGHRMAVMLALFGGLFWMAGVHLLNPLRQMGWFWRVCQIGLVMYGGGEVCWRMQYQINWVPVKWVANIYQSVQTDILGLGDIDNDISYNAWLFSAEANNRLLGAEPIDPLTERLKGLMEQAKKEAEAAKLVLCVVPSKITIYPDNYFWLNFNDPLRWPGLGKKLDQLKESGWLVVDPTQRLFDLRLFRPMYQACDSTWGYESIKETSIILARELRLRWPDLFSDFTTPVYDAKFLKMEGRGSQLIKMDPYMLIGGDALLTMENGDFNYGEEDEALKAGLVTHMATMLGKSVDAFAREDEVGVRSQEDLIQVAQEVLTKKRVIVMVVRAEDL
jgi:hypothetical protein